MVIYPLIPNYEIIQTSISSQSNKITYFPPLSLNRHQYLILFTNIAKTKIILKSLLTSPHFSTINDFFNYFVAKDSIQ